MLEMSPVLLTRIGLVCDFVAAFLLAPEILGVGRLRKAEALFEELLRAVARESMLGLAERTKRILDEERSFSLAVVVLTLISWIGYSCLPTGVMKTIVLGLAVSNTAYLIYTLDQPRLARNLKSKKKGCRALLGLLVWLVLMLIAIPTMLLDVVLWFPIGVSARIIVWMILLLLRPVSSRILPRLEGEDSLRSGLVLAGVLLFAAGFVLQYLGTQ